MSDTIIERIRNKFDIDQSIRIIQLPDFKNYYITESGEIISTGQKLFKKLCFVNRTGFYQVSLYANGSKHTRQIHKLVATNFVQNRDNRRYICHIDGNYTNNNAKNLRWENNNSPIYRSTDETIDLIAHKLNLNRDIKIKQIKDFLHYFITSDSRLISIHGNSIKEMQLCDDAIGHKCTILCNGEVRRTTRLHVLLAEAFIPNVDNKLYIKNIDGNPYNNAISNLEWTNIKPYFYDKNCNELSQSIIDRIRIKFNVTNDIYISQITNFTNYYVSSDGQVFSKHRNGVKKLITTIDRKNGYLGLYLSNNKIHKKHHVHRLVAEAFVSNPDNKPCVNHLSGIKTDNHAENLEFATYTDNANHAYELGLRIATTRKLTTERAKEIRELYSTGKYSQAKLSKIYDVSTGIIWHIVNNKTYIKR